jgi:hypothetical protein
MCCKLLEITEIEKPQNVWCKQCKPGKGCSVYDTRPSDCRTFYCSWIFDLSLNDAWRPDRSKFVITYEPETFRMFIVCDAGAAGAWRREPFYARIKSFLNAPGMERQQIVITTGRKLTLLVRNGEFDLGDHNKGDQISVTYDKNGGAPTARLVRAAQVGEQQQVAGA